MRWSSPVLGMGVFKDLHERLNFGDHADFQAGRDSSGIENMSCVTLGNRDVAIGHSCPQGSQVVNVIRLPDVAAILEVRQSKSVLDAHCRHRHDYRSQRSLTAVEKLPRIDAQLNSDLRY